MAFSLRRVVLNPRAYITPFLLLVVLHHLPIFIAYGVIDRPSGFKDCKRVKDLFVWLDVAFIVHVVVASIILLIIGTTLCSSVYRHHRPESTLILLLFLLYIFMLVWGVYGESSFPADTSDCPNDSEDMQDAADDVTYFQHFDFVFSLVIVIVAVFTSYMCGVHTNSDILEAEQRWQRRCMCMFRMFTCKSTRSHKTDDDIFASLGKILGKLFVVRYKTQQYQGLQFNDLMFCLGLVSRAQQHEREETEEADRQTFKKFPKGIEEHKLRDLAFYGRLAVGMYGWPMYVWYTPLKWFKIFDCFSSCNRKKRSNTEQVIDHDNAVTSNRASFINYTGINNDSLMYLNCYNFVFSAPYSIVKDQQRRELIISVRGSFSFYDFVTDGLAHIVNMDPDELPVDIPDAESASTHYGMLRTARSLYNDLQEGTRKPLFWDFAMEHCTGTSPEPWNIVICGHSMGAGVASILCLLMRRQFPMTRAYLYAPPMMFDAVTADWTRKFMFTAVYGDDMVPRLSLANVTRLRDEMVGHYNAVAQERLYKVKYGKLKNGLPTKAPEMRVGELAVDATGATAPVSPGEVSSDGQPKAGEARDERSDSASHTGLLGLDFLRTADIDDVQEVDVPGEIVHIQTVNKARTCSCTVVLGEQQLTYTLRDASHFRRIWANARAPQDHMVHHYDRNIRHLIDCLGYKSFNDDNQIIIDLDPEEAAAATTSAAAAALKSPASFDQIGDFEPTKKDVNGGADTPKSEYRRLDDAT